MEYERVLKDLGEKKIISEIILPLINPNKDYDLAGDDCATIKLGENRFVCISTDRVPSDLISFKLGLIDYYQLGYYLAVLNISDIMANGATPIGLLLNFAFPGDFEIVNFKLIYNGVLSACDEYDCQIIGGDLSDSNEINLVATSIGICENHEPLYRRGCKASDFVYCSDYIGLTPTAFLYFLTAKPKGLLLTKEEEEVLINQFSKPIARKYFSKLLVSINKYSHVTCMDNTDGIYQSLFEICQLNRVSMILDSDKLPVHPISYKLAKMLNMNIFDVVLSAGADFQLVGTIASKITDADRKEISIEGYTEIGDVICSSNGNKVYLSESDQIRELNIPGWNYYSKLV